MSRQTIFGIWKAWGYVSATWIGYELRSPDKTTLGYIKSLPTGLYKAGVCWAIPPLGIMMIRDELKNLDFHPGPDD